MKYRVVTLALMAMVFTFIFLPPAQADSQVPAASQSAQDKLSQRLETIEQKQNEILAQLADIKEELDVVKIRATLKG